MDSDILLLGAVVVLLVLSGFFSGSETALTASSRHRMHMLAQQGVSRAELVNRLWQDRDRVIGSILVGNNLVNILASTLSASLFISWFGDAGIAYATLLMTVLVVVFAEVLPKTYAITNPETAAARVAAPIAVVIRLFSPVVSAVRLLVRGVLRVFGVRTDPDSQILAVREEIAGALHLGHSEGVVQKEDRDRILGALDLGDRTVEEIMLHRSNIEMIDADTPPQDILQQCLESSHTRLPVFRGDPENIIGMIHAKDLLRAMYKLTTGEKDIAEALAGFKITDVMMKPYFVPDTTALDEQMRQFLRRRTHFALVVDEYGSLQGLITLEDILEEIVGEIEDEYDVAVPGVRPQPDGSVNVDGSVPIRDLNRAMDWELPDEDAVTVAGLVIHEAQTIPRVGQTFIFHRHRFQIVRRERNQITALRVSPPIEAPVED